VTRSHAICAALFAVAALPAAADCGRDVYFSARDISNAIPLERPSRDFSALQRAAHGGKAEAQRSLAVSYDSGYLVARCPARALHWYRLAARNGDAIAKDWMDRHARLEALREGPECLGATCFDNGGETSQTLSLIADASRHFRAPVTVNGISADGIIDTGASFLSMSAAQAGKMGIMFADGRAVTMQTANGGKQGKVVTVPKVSVGSLTLRDVAVSVSEVDMPLLVGMSLLSRLNIDIRGSSMTLAAR
jgi:clan AA aspartic protease (TIGR02281 family)